MQLSPSSTGTRRLGAVVGPALLGAFVLASCGGGDSGATQSTLDLSASSTAFVVRPPATTEPPIDTAADPTAVIEGTQDYTIQSGDYWYGLVDRFGVSIEDLLAVNEWTDINAFPNPGDVILIPPGGKSVDAVANAPTDTATGDDTPTDTTTDEAATVTIPDAGDNCAPGTYTIADTDTSRSKVASNFDVTVAALDAANVNTAGYGAFFPGLEIVIPAKSDC